MARARSSSCGSRASNWASNKASPLPVDPNPFSPPTPIQVFNDIVHQPILGAIIYVIFWSGFCLISPIGAIFLIFLYLPIVVSYEVYIKVRAFIYDRSNRTSSFGSDHAELVVVITGCDTGFGNDLAMKLLSSSPPPCHLSTTSFTVFALCYSEAGCARIVVKAKSKSASKFSVNQIFPLQCDVTNEQSVAGAFSSVEAYIARPNEGGSKKFLHAVVNNAGVGTPGYVDMIPIKNEKGKMLSFQRDMEVNYFGALRVVKAALPLIKAQATSSTKSSRYVGTCVVNVTSMAGLVASPNMGAYTGSKHAMEAVSTCLSYELRPWGCNVTTVNPSFHKTPLVDGISNGIDILWRESSTAQSDYGVKYCTELKKKSVQGSKIAEWRSHNVADCIYDTIRHGRSGQVMVGTDARFVICLMRHLPAYVQRFLVAGWPGAQFYVGEPVELSKNKLE